MSDFPPKTHRPLYPKVPAASAKVPASCGKKTPCLFDIIADAGEHNDVASSNAAIVKKMLARLAVLQPPVCVHCPPGFQPLGPPDDTKSKVCDMTKANGMFLTPSDWTPPSDEL